MNVTEAFSQFQQVVNADDDQVSEARRRRNLFRDALEGDDDVIEVRASGSLARGTQKDPIHDVDSVLVFDRADHPDWGYPGDSAEAALNHTQARVRSLLGSEGTFAAGEVRLTRWRNHAVKCFLDDPGDPGAFTVDVMPALVDGEMFLIPEYASKTWVRAHPQYLIDRVKEKHAEWNKYAGSVRMLKYWGAGQGMKIKSLVMEVLALDHLPADRSRPAALKEFFASAAYAIEGGLKPCDPAGVCGEIQHDLDIVKLGELLRAASDNAARAFAAQARGDQSTAITSWGDVFGDEFPQPPRGASGAAIIAPAMPRPVKDTPQG